MGQIPAFGEFGDHLVIWGFGPGLAHVALAPEQVLGSRRVQQFPLCADLGHRVAEGIHPQGAVQPAGVGRQEDPHARTRRHEGVDPPQSLLAVGLAAKVVDHLDGAIGLRGQQGADERSRAGLGYPARLPSRLEHDF